MDQADDEDPFSGDLVDHPVTAEEGVLVHCEVTGESCVVTAVDRVARQAIVAWTLPDVPGVQSLNVAVGNWNYFISARDDVEVQ